MSGILAAAVSSGGTGLRSSAAHPINIVTKPASVRRAVVREGWIIMSSGSSFEERKRGSAACSRFQPIIFVAFPERNSGQSQSHSFIPLSSAQPFHIIWMPTQSRMKAISRIITSVPVSPSRRSTEAEFLKRK